MDRISRLKAVMAQAPYEPYFGVAPMALLVVAEKDLSHTIHHHSTKVAIHVCKSHSINLLYHQRTRLSSETGVPIGHLTSIDTLAAWRGQGEALRLLDFLGPVHHGSWPYRQKDTHIIKLALSK